MVIYFSWTNLLECAHLEDQERDGMKRIFGPKREELSITETSILKK
jgi:hypothetical protein